MDYLKKAMLVGAGVGAAVVAGPALVAGAAVGAAGAVAVGAGGAAVGGVVGLLTADPDPVRKLKSDVTENSVLLTWDANLRTNEDKVCITYRAESDMWSPRSIASCNEKKFSKENLRPGFRYEFRVWVLNGARKSISRYITVDLGQYAQTKLWHEEEENTRDVTFYWNYTGKEQFSARSFELELRRMQIKDQETTTMLGAEATRHTFNNLTPGQTYTLKITAITSNQMRSKPKETQVTIKPLAPTEVWHEEEEKTSRVTFYWSYTGTDEFFATRFELELNRKGNTENSPVPFGVNGTCYTFNNLIPGETYTLKITAVTSNGVRSEPKEKEITTKSHVQMEVWYEEKENTDVTFFWSRSRRNEYSTSRYELELIKGNTGPFLKGNIEKGPVSLGVGASSYTFNSLILGQTYTFKITAVTHNRERSKPKETQITIKPLPPTEVWHEEGENTSSVTFYWSYSGKHEFPPFRYNSKHDSSAMGHELELTRKGNTEKGPVEVGAEATRYTFNDLLPGQTYTFKITAVTSNKVRSKPKETQITLKPLPPPEIWHEEEEKTSGVTFYWSYSGKEKFPDLSDNGTHDSVAMGYELELKRKGNTEKGPVEVGVGVTSYTFNDLIPGQTYTLKITAITSNQVRSKSKETQITISTIPTKVEDFPNSTNCPFEKEKVLEEVNSKCKVISQMFSPKAIKKDNEDVSEMVLAAKNGNFSKVFQILEKKPNIVNAIPAERAWSVLHQAVFHDNVDVVKRILSLPNCDANIKAKRDRAAVGYAGMSPYELAQRKRKKCQSVLMPDATKTKVQELTFLALTDDDALPFSNVPYYDIAVSFLKTDLVKKITCYGSDFTKMSEQMYNLLENDWEYVRCAVTECLYPFDKAIAEDLRCIQSKDELKEKIIYIYTHDSVYLKVNGALRRASNTDFPVGDDLLLSLYSLFFHSILLCWDELKKVTQITYRGVGLPADQADKYKEGVTFCWLPFTSSSCIPDVAQIFISRSNTKPAVFEIDNHQSSQWSPRNIASMSKYKEEMEVLHPSGARFQVTGVEQMPDHTKYKIKLL